MTENFKFNLNSKRTRLTNKDLIQALVSAADAYGNRYFTCSDYSKLPGMRPNAMTIIRRFGSWKKALALIGIEGGREWLYDADELIENLEAVWMELGYPPGRRQLARRGKRISESPYERYWGSVRGACEALAEFHNGRMSREQLLAGNAGRQVREAIPLRVRWTVMKRDNFRCQKCGAAPSADCSVELEVDHKLAVSKGGSSNLENLQTLCRKCNQGKKDR